MQEMRNVYKLKVRDQLGNFGADGRIILKWNLDKLYLRV
jgi:hypothetical protein